MSRRPSLAQHLKPVIEDLINRKEITYNITTGETNIVIGTQNGHKPMKVTEGRLFTGIEMPDGSAILVDRREPVVKGERGR